MDVNLEGKLDSLFGGRRDIKENLGATRGRGMTPGAGKNHS